MKSEKTNSGLGATDAESAATPPQRFSRGALLRVAAIALVVIAGVIAIRHPAVQANLQEDKVIELLERFRSHPLGVPILILGFITLACLGTPVTFLMLTTGAVYGAFPGGLFALASSVISGSVTFGLAKMIGDDLNIDRFGTKLGPMRKKIERQLNRHGFWNLVSFRFLPIPYAIANTLLALTGVKFSKFALSTTLALVPTSFAWTYFAQSIVGATEASRAVAIRNIAIGLVSLLALSLVPEILRRIRRLKRFQDVTAERQNRR